MYDEEADYWGYNDAEKTVTQSNVKPVMSLFQFFGVVFATWTGFTGVELLLNNSFDRPLLKLFFGFLFTIAACVGERMARRHAWRRSIYWFATALTIAITAIWV